MKLWIRTLIALVVTLLVVGCDQVTKLLAIEYLPKEQMTSYFNDFVRVGYSENIGVFLGLGSSFSAQTRFWLFVVVVGIFLFALLCYLLTNAKQTFSQLLALCLLFSGGISNFYDRASNDGAVVDFLNVGISSLRTGIFNVADLAIMLGIILILFSKNSTKGSNPYASLKMER